MNLHGSLKVLKENLYLVYIPMQELSLPTESFSVSRMQQIFDEGHSREAITSVISYINEYYLETENGMYYFFDAAHHVLRVVDRLEFKRCVLDKLNNHKSVEHYYKQNNIIYKVVSQHDMPQRYRLNDEHYLNLCQGYMHKEVQLFDSYPDHVKEAARMFLSFMMEVVSGGDDDFYQALLKYMGQLCRGLKTGVILYAKGLQGTGKSTFKDFIFNHLLGPALCLSSSAEPLTGDFNYILLGKLVVVFEELPVTFGKEWSKVSNRLKQLATEETMVYRNLYKEGVVANNISNVMVFCNNESIMESDGRRIIHLPMSTHRKQDEAYFGLLRRTCFHNEVGEALYAYFREVNVTGFHAEKGFPITKKKLFRISENLQPTERFLKHIVLSETDLGRIKPGDVYDRFVEFAEHKNLKRLTKNMFVQRLEELGIQVKKSGTHFFDLYLDKLRAIAARENWITDLDIEEYTESHRRESLVTDEVRDLRDRIAALERENEELRKQVYPRCQTPTCASTARFGHTDATHCSKHKEEGMNNVRDAPPEARRKVTEKSKETTEIETNEEQESANKPTKKIIKKAVPVTSPEPTKAIVVPVQTELKAVPKPIKKIIKKAAPGTPPPSPETAIEPVDEPTKKRIVMKKANLGTDSLQPDMIVTPTLDVEWLQQPPEPTE